MLNSWIDSWILEQNNMFYVWSLILGFVLWKWIFYDLIINTLKDKDYVKGETKDNS